MLATIDRILAKNFGAKETQGEGPFEAAGGRRTRGGAGFCLEAELASQAGHSQPWDMLYQGRIADTGSAGRWLRIRTNADRTLTGHAGLKLCAIYMIIARSSPAASPAHACARTHTHTRLGSRGVFSTPFPPADAV